MLLYLLFLKIENPESTNLTGPSEGAPIHRHFTNLKTNTLSRDRSILQHFIHTTGIRCFLSIHGLQCDCECDLRARCTAAVRSHTPNPLLETSKRSLSSGWVSRKNVFLDVNMCWLQKHNSGQNSHTEVQFMVYLSSAPHSYAVFDSATAVSWRQLQKTTSPSTRALYPQQGCGHIEP